MIEITRLRATAFPAVYFEKESDARTGSKCDHIFRETSKGGINLLLVNTK